MKSFKDYIYEGVLADVDTNINKMDSDLEIAERDRLRNLFPVNIKLRGKHCVSIVNRGVYYGGKVLDDFIDNCCSLDGNELTIDLNKQASEELTVTLFAKNLIREGIIVKVLDHANRPHVEEADIATQGAHHPSVTVLGDDYEVDLSKILHSGSRIEILKIGGDGFDKARTTWLKDSNVNCTILGYVEYNCTIKRITKFPDKIKLTKPVYRDILLKTLKLNNANAIFGFNGNLSICK